MGTIGKPMATRLLQSGFRLIVHDVNPVPVADLVRQGAGSASSPRQTAQESQVTILSLPSYREVETVVLGDGGVLQGLTPGKVLIDMTTSLPTVTRRIAPLISGPGAHLLDAPVSGGPGRAAKGELSIMVGGAEEIFQQARPILETMGKHVVYTGGTGCGHICKLVANLIAGVNMAVLAEGLLLGVRAGVDPQVLIQVVSGSSGQSRMCDDRAWRILEGSFEPAAGRVDILYKDLITARTLAEEIRSPIPVGTLVAELYQVARAMGRGEWDLAAIGTVYERMTGILVKDRARAGLGAV
ncbi:MAG: NAD(P)-dependent oxidoreductase [Armatimonadetes bacterium]|nr:NAD(P)-dependent oxidoreductase [Armatimonadota bacterium]